jgi:hypothetical protein
MTTFNTATIIHIDESLSDNELEAVERELAEYEGVVAACVHEKSRHLMVVDYDPLEISADNLLHYVQNQGFHAELVGGI